MIYGSVCSGIEAATVAWHPLGWKPAWFSEIDKFPSAVLAHHYPNTPNLGDFTEITDDDAKRIAGGLLVGGTPCQDLSGGGAGAGWWAERSGLAWHYVDVVRRSRCRWFVWENVARAIKGKHRIGFSIFVERLVQLGYGLAWRVLNSQYFNSPMRGERVFVVGCLGDGRSAVQALFDGEAVTDMRAEVAGVPRIDASGLAKKQTMPDKGRCWTVHDGQGHRFLTPVEAERCFGFPDNYTRIPYRNKPADRCPDGPRYKALGNSMAVNVMRWIGTRIEAVEAVTA